MTYKEFQQLARLFIVGSLDEEEMERFCSGRLQFGHRAEEFILECRKLNIVFALSLRPMPPAPSTKARLLARIREQSAERLALTFEEPDCKLVCTGRILGRN